MTTPSAVPPTPEQVTDYYGALGPLIRMAWGDNFHFGYWDGPSDTSTAEAATDRFTDLLTERLAVKPGDRVLDVGCGVGRPALRVASTTGAHVTGITISREQVEQANELATAEGMAGQVGFEYADGMDMPFAAESFDAVLAFESIVHMDRAVALREMARVLKPGGRVVLTDTFSLDEGAGSDTGDVASMGRIEDYPGLVEGAGLRLDEVTDVTEHTKFTFMRMLDSVFRCRREFEREHGMTIEQVFASMKPAHPEAASAGMASNVGCLVVAAHRP